MEVSLELKQTQKLSAQMIQSMEILQMGIPELQEYVETVLMENPTLELESEGRKEERPELLKKLDWLNATDHQNRWYHQGETQDLMDLASDSAGESLYDYLREQLDMERMSPQLQAAVDCVLTGLNHDGYLEESVEELAARSRTKREAVTKAVGMVQGLEPAGVAARSLSECLALQLKRNGQEGLALTIAQSYLEDMARNHFNRISKETGASREDIQHACNQIRKLNPRPGAPFAPKEIPGYIIPDLLVTEENGRLAVAVGDDFLPVLKVSSYYQHLMETCEEAEVQEYLAEKIRQATWVVKSIDQRKSTLLACARVIVARQKAFFTWGKSYLLPMTLADIAAEAGLHESTVSRAIRDKYIQCAQGVIPLNRLFSRAVSSECDEVSPERAKDAIRNLIQSENKKKPLSDQKLCDLLSRQNLILSRRTVAKYRDEMGIPSTSGRKEY